VRGKRNNTANIGDIIISEHYPAKEFQVEAYTHERYYSAMYEEESIIYDATCLGTGQYTLFYQEDVKVVVKAEQADDYIRSKYGDIPLFTSAEEQAIVNDILSEFSKHEKATIEERGDVEKSKPMSELKTEEVTEEQRIDRLLDEINDYNGLIRMFGDEDKKYELAICEAKAKLREITEGGR